MGSGSMNLYRKLIRYVSWVGVMIRSLLKNWKLNSIAVFSLAIAMALSQSC